MEKRDTKIQTGVKKIDTKLQELDSKRKALGKQEIPSLASLDNTRLAQKYFEMDRLESDYAKKKKELGLDDPEIVIDGHTPAEWKEGIKKQIEINKINSTRAKLKEAREELEKHYTEDYEVDKILASL